MNRPGNNSSSSRLPVKRPDEKDDDDYGLNIQRKSSLITPSGFRWHALEEVEIFKGIEADEKTEGEQWSVDDVKALVKVLPAYDRANSGLTPYQRATRGLPNVRALIQEGIDAIQSKKRALSDARRPQIQLPSKRRRREAKPKKTVLSEEQMRAHVQQIYGEELKRMQSTYHKCTKCDKMYVESEAYLMSCRTHEDHDDFGSTMNGVYSCCKTTVNHSALGRPSMGGCMRCCHYNPATGGYSEVEIPMPWIKLGFIKVDPSAILYVIRTEDGDPTKTRVRLKRIDDGNESIAERLSHSHVKSIHSDTERRYITKAELETERDRPGSSMMGGFRAYT